MKKNTVILDIDIYDELMSNNDLYHKHLEDSNSKIEKILNGESVELLEPLYFESGSGAKFKVRSGCNFYSVSDSIIELKKEIKGLAELNEKIDKQSKAIIKKLKERTLLDFLLKRNK